MNKSDYKICTRCVMDTSDPDIQFDSHGICNHCHTRDKVVSKIPKGKEAELQLEKIVSDIKKDGKGREYDCIIGVSGGVDSSYLAYIVNQVGLRALAVHLDNGWNSELAVKNIENLLNKLNIELYTHVIDWEEFRDLQLAFLKASTPDSEIPSDHAIFATVIKTSWQRNIKHIIWGFNSQTESHLPAAWSSGHMDWKYIRSIHGRFGTVPLNTYPYLNFWEYHKYMVQQKKYSHSLLELINFNKEKAMSILQNELGWKYYGGKHYESIYTRFYQGYILPQKFGFDKRRTHLSSLICSGEITRKEALKELEKPAYPLELQMDDKEYAIKKFNLTPDQFEQIMKAPLKTFWDYPSYAKFYKNAFYEYAKNLYKRLSQ